MNVENQIAALRKARALQEKYREALALAIELERSIMGGLTREEFLRRAQITAALKGES